jgi:hypothetical protein
MTSYIRLQAEQFIARRLPAVQANKRKLLFDRRDVEAFIDAHKKTA